MNHYFADYLIRIACTRVVGGNKYDTSQMFSDKDGKQNTCIYYKQDKMVTAYKECIGN